MIKSMTDRFWDERAVSEADDAKVNIADLAQRELENEFILSYLEAGTRVLEVGCGNGLLTQALRQHVAFVDAFDYSQNMIARAQKLYGETNNRFFNDNILEPKLVKPPYDAIVCVRVLINLRDLTEQKRAVANMASLLRASGRLILVEGFKDGFNRLNDLRRQSGIEPLKPASINFYSNFAELSPELEKWFHVTGLFHTGAFDFLTRVIYPALVGAENAQGYSDFHDRILPVAKAFNVPDFEPLARVRGWALNKK